MVWRQDHGTCVHAKDVQVLLRRVGALAITVLAAIAAMAAVNVSTLLLNVAVIVLTNFAADALQSTLDPRLVR